MGCTNDETCEAGTASAHYATCPHMLDVYLQMYPKRPIWPIEPCEVADGRCQFVWHDHMGPYGGLGCPIDEGD